MTETAVQIRFPVKREGAALVVPPAPETPANATLEPVVASVASVGAESARRQLVCREMLAPESLRQAEQEAAQMLDKMLKNNAIFLSYGADVLAPVNDLIAEARRKMTLGEPEEVRRIVDGVRREMLGLESKYDPSDPKVRERYESWKGGLSRFWGKGKSLYHLLMEDVLPLDKKINGIRKQVQKEMQQLIEFVLYYDELYERNEREQGNLIYKIAVMELIAELAGQRAAALTPDPSNPADRTGEVQATLAQFAGLMQNKIAEYKGRLLLAQATSVAVRMMRYQDIGLASGMNELVNVVIPTMDGVILNWQIMAKSGEVAKTRSAVRGLQNQLVTSYGNALGTIVPAIADEVETPSLSPEAIYAMARGIREATDGVIAAMDRGAQRRAEQEEAMAEAQQVFADSARDVSDALVERIVRKVQPVQLVPSATALR